MTETIELMSLLRRVGPTIASGNDDRDRNATFVAENYDMLREHKVFSALVPTELGGGGAAHSEMCAFIRGLAGYCSSTALALSMHQHLVAAAVFNYRNRKPGQKLLEKVAKDEAVLISTGANDWMESNGNAVRADGGYRVSARKPFASGSPSGHLLVTSAPFCDPDDGWQVLHFPVPLSAKGVSLADDWDALGMRATGSRTVILENVFVPEDAVALRRPQGRYHPAWNVILTVAMPLIMSAYAGVAEAAADKARELAQRRRDDPTLPVLLGELRNELTTAQIATDAMVALAADWNFAPTAETASEILIRKTIAAKAVLRTVDKAMEVAGGMGFYRKWGLERLARDAQGVRYHPLPEKAQQEFTGRLALGLDPISDAMAAPLQAAAE